MSHKGKIRILSFNCWLVRTPIGFDVAKDIELRLAQMPTRLAATGADILCLQEVWDPKIRKSLCESLAKFGYLYFDEVEYERLGINGFSPLRIFHRHFSNGLLTLSKYPLSKKYPPLVFPQYTRPDEILICKGATANEIALPSGESILVCNSHLGAVSFSASSGTYNRRHLWNRLRQARSLVKWLKQFSSQQSLFLAIDLNVHFRAWGPTQRSAEYSKEVRLLMKKTLKGFSLQEVNLTLGRHEPLPQFTFHSQNPYVATGFFGHLPNEVTDYLFYREENWKAVSCATVFLPENTAPALSDHYGVLAEFEKTNLLN